MVFVRYLQARLFGTDRRKNLTLLALGGILTGLCLVFPKLGFLEWLTLCPMALAVLRLCADPTVRLRRLYGYGLWFCMSFSLVYFHWFISMYPLEFTGIGPGAALVVVLFAWIGLSFFQSAMGALTFVVAGLVFRLSAIQKYPLLRPFLFAAIWTVYEWTQNLGWWGVPWSRLALGQVEYLVGLQTASWFGSYFVTFLLVSVNFLGAYALMTANRGRVCRGAVVGMICILVFQYGAGSMIWLSRDAETDRTVTVGAVQGNISSKWDDTGERRASEIYAEGTRQAAAAGAEIVIWPETAVTSVIRQSTSSVWFSLCSDLAKENEIVLLVGAFSEEGGEKYNSIFCFLPDGSCHQTLYHKRKLVPFGEFVPAETLIETLVPPLAELVLSGSDLTAGSDAGVFELPEGDIGSLICFDSIYDGLTRQSVLDGAELLCLSTNDSWFGTSRALYMHTAQAQLRAVESGRDVLRSANTGLSCAINARGQIIDQIPVETETVLVCRVSYRESVTLYTRMGNLFVYLCLFGVVVLSGWQILELVREKKKGKIT